MEAGGTVSFDLAKAMANGGRCQTRDGKPARIICTDMRDTQPILALIDNNGAEYSATFSREGIWNRGGLQSENDLVNVTVKREGWVNICPPDDSRSAPHVCQIFRTKTEADERIWGHRIACVRIEWEEPA